MDLSWLISLELGIILELLIDKYKKKETKWVPYVIALIAIITAILFVTLLKDNVDKALSAAIANGDTPEPFYLYVEEFLSFFNNVFVSVVIVTITSLIIAFMLKSRDNLYTTSTISKHINDFTKIVDENSTLYLVSGDMSSWGCYDDFQNNPEYKLLNEKRSLIEIKIICRHEIQSELIKDILDNNVFFEDAYTYVKKSGSLEQVLRIGKMKDEFGSKIDFRYYDDDCIDYNIRARLIKPYPDGTWEVIQYKYIRESSRGNKLYSFERFSDKNRTYMYMITDQWKRSNSSISIKITNFCHEIYLHHIGKRHKKEIVLLYAESYEIAHFYEERKEFPPFGILYIAAVIEEYGWNVTVKSISYSNKLESFDFSRFDVVGLSIVSSYSFDIFKNSLSINKSLQRHPQIITGGLHAEAFKSEVFDVFNARVIFRGESEDSIKEYLNAFDNSQSFASINGIYYRKPDNSIAATAKRKKEPDLDTIPIPARHKLVDDNVFMENRLAGTTLKMAHLLFSRGCSKNCYFCANMKKKVRYRSAVKIKDEISQLVASNSIKGFSIIDDCFLTDELKAIEICKELSTLGLKWSFSARVDQINDNILIELKKAGCIEIKLGVETASDFLLEKMNKGFTVQHTKDSIKLINKYGLKVKIFLITGLPFESEITNNETKAFLSEMGKDNIRSISLLRFVPLPGSYIYNNPTLFGINPKALNDENYKFLHLYRSNINWWTESTLFETYNKIHEDIKMHIMKIWNEC